MSPARRRVRPKLPTPESYTPFFSRREKELYCEGVPLERIAGRVGTPCYVYSRASIEAAYRKLDGIFAGLPHSLCYAVKANSNLSILRVLAKLGSRFDIVSGGELYRVRRIGVSARRVVFSGVGKSAEEIREALRENVLLLNVESEAELELVQREAARLRKRASAAIRVNPDVVAGGHPHIATGHHQHKFGVDWAAARKLYLRYKDSRWIEWRGISAHIGSQILSVAPFGRAVRRMGECVRELRRAGIAIEYFDFGGGVGIRYSEEKPPELRRYAREIKRVVKPLGCHLLLEPGRVIVGPAGVLVMKALYTKRTRGKDFVIVDAGMNDFMRPALYGAVHPVTPVVATADRGSGTRSTYRADIVGPVCETGDCFLHDWPIERVGEGDLLVLWGAGAYGMVNATNYNSRPRGAEILVEGRRFRTIRRRESRSDLVRGE